MYSYITFIINFFKKERINLGIRLENKLQREEPGCRENNYKAMIAKERDEKGLNQ